MYGNSASALSNFNPQTLASIDNSCPNRPLLCWPINKLLFLPIIPAVVNNSLQSRAFLPWWFLYITTDIQLTILLPLSPSLLFLGWPRQISFRLVLGSVLHVLICFFPPIISLFCCATCKNIQAHCVFSWPYPVYPSREWQSYCLWAHSWAEGTAIHVLCTANPTFKSKLDVHAYVIVHNPAS